MSIRRSRRRRQQHNRDFGLVSVIQGLEVRTLLSAVTAATVEAVQEIDNDFIDLRTAESLTTSFGEFQFQLANRWTRTAHSGSGLLQGQPTVITWGFADEGTPIPGFRGEPAANNSLISFLDSIRGAGPGGSDLTQRPWFEMFDDSFGRWTNLSGITFRYEPNDDGVAFSDLSSAAGVVGVRADMRIGGHFIDGGANILAYNFFPNFGEMVIDTGDPSYYSDATNDYRNARNTIMHEIGHGLGLRHVESSDSNPLLEPQTGTRTFQGPQLDDVLAVHRSYGDALEDRDGTDSTSEATDLGNLAFGQTIRRGTLGNSTVVSWTLGVDDFVSIDDESDPDYYKFTVSNPSQVQIVLTPRGVTYQQGPENGTQTAFNSKTQSNLTLQLISGNGTTVLGTANNTGLGGSEILSTGLLAIGTYYVRVSGSTLDAVQMYGLDISSGSPEIIVRDGSTNILDGTGNLSFGTTPQGTNVDKILTITNGGPATLALTSPTLTGPFSLAGSFPSTIAPGASATFMVRLTAATVGSATGTISFDNNDLDEVTFNFALTGTITVAPAEINVLLNGTTPVADGTGSVYFGETTVGTEVTKAFTIKNTGTGTLTLSAPTFTGPFSLSGSFPTSIAAGSSDTFYVRMAATAVGTTSGTISFTNNDGNESPFNFAISGKVSTNLPATTRVSVSSTGVQENHDGFRSSISADGRYVTYDSIADDLVAGDTNGTHDVFLFDRQTQQTTRISVNTAGLQANGASTSPSISADGRYVAFESNANNLVAGDTNSEYDVFLHDRQTGTTTRVSVSSAGVEGNRGGSNPSVSADGRYVTFESTANNLVAGDTGGAWDIFVYDRQTQTTTRVSVSSAGVEGNSGSFDSSISADGRYVTFDSFASNLVAGDTNGAYDIFVFDRQTQQTTRVSVGTAGVQSNGKSINPAISADGRYVTYESDASNLVAGDTNGFYDIFVFDRQTQTTTRVSVNFAGVQGNSGSYGPAISADGRYVSYQSYASNLVADDTNGVPDVFVFDRQTGATTRVSVNAAGVQGNDTSYGSSMSADGRYVTYNSIATNLVAGDTNGFSDIFVIDRAPQVAPEIEVFSGVDNILDNVTTVAFGDVRQSGTPVQNVLTIRNLGTSALKLQPAVFSLGSGFSIVGTNFRANQLLAAGGSVTLTVRLDSVVPGSKTATLTIPNDDANENPFEIKLDGRVVTPEIEVLSGADNILDNVTTVAFGDVRQSGTPVQKVLTIRNLGTSALKLQPAVFSLGSGFSIVGTNFTANQLLAAGGSVTLTVQLDNVLLGSKTATLKITNDDANENPFEIKLGGRVVAPEIAVLSGVTNILDNVTTIAFGDVRQSVTPVQKVLTIRNLGTSALTLQPAVFSLGSGFSIVGTNFTANQLLAVGASVTLTVQLDSVVLGSKTATLTIPNDDANENPFEIKLGGRVVAPEIAVLSGVTDILDDMTTVAFGDVRQSGTPVQKVLTIRNFGTSALKLQPAVFSLGSGFSIVGTNFRANQLLAAGGSVTLTVRLDSLVLGSKAATLTIPNDDANENPFEIKLGGQVVAPEIEVLSGVDNILDNVTTVAFGDVRQSGTPVQKVLTIRNLGTSALKLQPAVFSLGSGFSIVGTTFTANQLLAAGGSVTLTVRLDSVVPGSKTATLKITNDDANENPFEIKFDGRVVAPEIEVLSGADNILDNVTSVAFGDVRQSGTPVQKVLTIRNLGTSALTLQPAVFSLGSGFSIVGTNFTANQLLAAGDSVTLTVQLDNVLLGSKTATLKITNDDANENPFEIKLGGRVVAPEIAVLSGVTNILDNVTTVAFGDVRQSVTPVQKVLTIRNLGTSALILQPAVFTLGSGFSIVGTNFTANQLLAVGASVTLTVQLDSVVPGSKTATLTIPNDDANENPFEIKLGGRVVAPAIQVFSGVDNILDNVTTVAIGDLRQVFSD